MILYLRKLIKNKIQERAITKEIAIELLKMYIEVILTNTLSEVCLQNIAMTLQDILNFRLVSENKNIVNELVDFLSSYLEKNIGTNILTYKNIILIYENIILSSSVSNSNAVEILKKILHGVEFMLNNIITIGFKSVDILNNVRLFLSYIDICKHIFIFLHSSVLKMRNRLSIINQVLDSYNQKFITIAYEMAIMTVPGVLHPQFIAFQGDSEFDNTINIMKAKVFQFINSIISNYKSVLEEEYLVKIYSNLIQITIDNLNFVVLNKFNYLQEMTKDSLNFPDYNYENLIYQMILFLSKILVKDPFVDNFAAFVKQFASTIIIPFLIGTKKELIQMIEEGEDYSNFISDVIDDHKTKTIKSVSGYLLQNLSEKYDGFANYLSSYCMQLVDFCVKGGDFANISQYHLLNSEDRIFKLTTIEFQIETSFLIFCILISNFLKNKVMLGNLKLLLSTHIETLFSVKSEIIKDRLCLFIGLFLDNLFEPEERNFSACVEFLLINLLSYKQNPGVAHKSADALNDLVAVKKISLSLKEIINKYLQSMIEQIKDIKIGLFFDVLLEIVIHVDIEECLITMVRELTKRVLTEIAPYTRIKFKVTNEDGKQQSSRREKDSQYNLIVNKCFNIIRTVTDNATYVTKYILIVEEILEPLFDHMKAPSKIDFDEDIVLIMTSFIKHLKSLPNSSLGLLPELPKYLKKSKGLMLDLYELINQYIVYGNGIVDVKEEFNKIIMKIFRASFDKKSDYDKSPFLGASLMQVWVQNSAAIPVNIVKEIVLISIDQIKNIIKLYKSREDLEDSSDLFTFIGLLVLIYSSFINYPQVAFEALISNNDMHNFLEWTQLLLKLKFYSCYQVKSLLIGICSIIKSEYLVKQIPDQINKLLSIMQLLLSKQKHEESKKLKTALKNEVNCNFIESDEEEENSDEENDEINSKINEMNEMLSKDMEKLYKKMDIEEYNGYTNEVNK